MWTQGLLALTLLTRDPAASPREAREPQTPHSFGSVAEDTVFAVHSGQRMTVDNFAGDVSVRTWGRDAVRVAATHTRRTRVDIGTTATEVQISSHGHMGPGSADMEISIPPWMPIQVQGVHTDISIMGSKGEIKAQTVHGDVDVNGGGNFVSLSSVDGAVKVVGARGRVQVSSVNDGVELNDVVGDITAESVNGNVVLVRSDSKSIEASTINGGVLFDGQTQSGGVYTLSTHNGDILVGLPDKPDVSVSVSTFGGNFSTFLPIQISETKKHKPITFVLGQGDAQLELESFQGAIRLEKLGASLQKAWERAMSGDEDTDVEAARKAREKARGDRVIIRQQMLEKMKIQMKKDKKEKDENSDDDDQDPDQKEDH
jgi:putative adhesin